MPVSTEPPLRSCRPLAALWRILALAALILPLGGRAAEPLPPSEYQIKAAFLFNFIKFVEWPPHWQRDTSSPFVIGVLGHDPFGSDLEAVIEGKRINDRAIRVKRFPSGTLPEECHVLFISSSERRRVPQIIQALQNTPTLTVGDGIERFCAMDGIINFVVEAKRVRFQINNQAAERQGLKISSKLLRLGVAVETGLAR